MAKTPEPPEQTVTAFCPRCGRPFQIPEWLSSVTDSWMKREWRDAEQQRRTAQPVISRKEIAVCDGCTEDERRDRAAAEESDRRWRDQYLNMVRSGVINPDAINWLRSHGHGAELDRIMKQQDELKRAADAKALVESEKAARKRK